MKSDKRTENRYQGYAARKERKNRDSENSNEGRKENRDQEYTVMKEKGLKDTKKTAMGQEEGGKGIKRKK